MKASIILLIRLLVIWSCIGLLFTLAHGQTPTAPYVVSVKSISIEHGLPNQEIITIGQDQQGFIWIGTIGNAYRFNGHQFSPLPTVAAPKKEQQYNPGFTTVVSDRLGNFWLTGSLVGNYRQQLVIRQGQTQPQLLDKAFAQPTHFQRDIVIEYATAADNTFQYFRTRNGIVWRQTKQGTFRPLFRYPKQCTAISESLYETAQHTLLITLLYKTDGELIEIDSTGRILHRRTLPGSLAQLKPIWKAPDGTIYFARLFSFDSAFNRETSRPDVVLYQLHPDGPLTSVPFATSNSAHESRAGVSVQYDPHRGLFWVLGMHNLQAWHPQQGLVFDLAKTDSPMVGMHKFKTQFIDHTGAIWVATTTGLLLINLEPNRFQRYLHVPANQSATDRYSIRGITQVGSQLWVNSTQCWLVDLKTGQKQFTLSPSIINPTYTTALCPVVRDQDGILWSALETLLRVDPKTFRASTFPLQAANQCVSIWPDDQHRLWLGFHHGLSVFDTKRAQFQPFTRYNEFGELAKSIINGFFPDKQAEGIWVAASSGLYLLDTLRGITARYSLQDSDSLLPFDHITFVHPDPDEVGVYWLATHGGGLIRWNRARKTYQVFTQKQGLTDNTLYAIYEDKHGRLWLPSNHGLMSFHRKTHQIQIFHTNDGIADEEFNLVAHHRAPDGRLFLGGLNGITAFYPDRIRAKKPVLAPLLVTQFQKLDTETGRLVDHFADFKEENDIHLTASDRLFTLGFTLLDYRHLGQTRLWYRIRGWQEKWVVLDRLELSINGLPSGDYTVEVRAQAVNGDWASPILSIPITVDKPFYLQVWFLLLVGGGILAAFRWRNQQLVRDKTQLEAEVARRTAQIEADKAIIEQQAADLQANATLEAELLARVQNLLRRADEQATWQQTEGSDKAADENNTDWIQGIQHIIRQNISNEFFNIELLAEMVNISKRQLNRRIKVCTGLSPNQLVQEVRLQVAYDILAKQSDVMIKSVAYQVGYQKTSHFIHLYRERFGINPGEQQRQAKLKPEEVVS